MSSSFDPYYTWLGIPPSDQPANHYRLLGISTFEDNEPVISHAADRQMAHVRSLQMGQHASDAQRVLNEIAAARVCLLNTELKRAYDEGLRRRLAQPAETVDTVASKPPPRPLPSKMAVDDSQGSMLRFLAMFAAGVGVTVLVGVVIALLISSDNDRDDLAIAPPVHDRISFEDSRDDRDPIGLPSASLNNSTDVTKTPELSSSDDTTPVSPTESARTGLRESLPNMTDRQPKLADATRPAITSSPLNLADIKQPALQQVEKFQEIMLPLDPDGKLQSSGFSWRIDGRNAPRGAKVSPATGVFTWKPGERDGPGEFDIGVIAENPLGERVELIVPVKVLEKNSKGWMDRIWFAEGHSGSSAIITFRVRDGDEPPNKMTYALEDPPRGLTINQETGDARWLPEPEDFGKKYVVRLWINDNGEPPEIVRGAFAILPPSPPSTQTQTPNRPARFVLRVHGHFQHARHLAFGPDGKTLYVTSTDGILKQWDVTNGRLDRTLDGRDFKSSGGLAAGGNLFVWGHNVWDVETDEIIHTLEQHGVGDAFFSADAAKLVVSDINHGTSVWDTKSKSRLLKLPRAWSSAISTSGRFAAANINDGDKIEIWDTHTGTSVTKIPVVDRPFYGLAFTPDEKLIAGAMTDGVVYVWEVATGRLVTSLETGKGLFAVAISPNGQHLASTGSLALWDTKSWQVVDSFPEVRQRTWSVAFSPDGNMLAAGHHDGSVTIWEIKTP